MNECRFSWFKSIFGRIWCRQHTNGDGRCKENLPLLLPAAVLARPIQAHQRHAQVWFMSDWTGKVLQLCSHTPLFFYSKPNADMVVCKYCMKTFRNKNSLGCHIWRWYFIKSFANSIWIYQQCWRFHKRGKELITKERGYQQSKALMPEVQRQTHEQTERTSHFQENNSALPSLTFQTSSNNGHETE